jgi:hypothetical protein
MVLSFLLGKLEVKMKHNEPFDTICWAAWHLYSEQFCDRWAAGELTFIEYKNLIDSCIRYVESMLASRSFYEIGMKKFDKNRLEKLNAIRQGLCTTLAEFKTRQNDGVLQ